MSTTPAPTLELLTATAGRLSQLLDPNVGPVMLWHQLKDRVPPGKSAAVREALLREWRSILFPSTLDLYAARTVRLLLVPGAAAVTVERLEKIGATSTAAALRPWASVPKGWDPAHPLKLTPGFLASRDDVRTRLAKPLREGAAQDLAAGRAQNGQLTPTAGAFVSALMAAFDLPPNPYLLADNDKALRLLVERIDPDLYAAISLIDDELATTGDLAQTLDGAGVLWPGDGTFARTLVWWRACRLDPALHPVAEAVRQVNSRVAEATRTADGQYPADVQTILDAAYTALGPQGLAGIPFPTGRVRTAFDTGVMGALAKLPDLVAALKAGTGEEPMVDGFHVVNGKWTPAKRPWTALELHLGKPGTVVLRGGDHEVMRAAQDALDADASSTSVLAQDLGIRAIRAALADGLIPLSPDAVLSPDEVQYVWATYGQPKLLAAAYDGSLWDKAESKQQSLERIGTLRRLFGRTAVYYEAIRAGVLAGTIWPSAVIGGGHKNPVKAVMDWLDQEIAHPSISQPAPPAPSAPTPTAPPVASAPRPVPALYSTVGAIVGPLRVNMAADALGPWAQALDRALASQGRELPGGMNPQDDDFAAWEALGAQVLAALDEQIKTDRKHRNALQELRDAVAAEWNRVWATAALLLLPVVGPALRAAAAAVESPLCAAREREAAALSLRNAVGGVAQAIVSRAQADVSMEQRLPETARENAGYVITDAEDSGVVAAGDDNALIPLVLAAEDVWGVKEWAGKRLAGAIQEALACAAGQTGLPFGAPAAPLPAGSVPVETVGPASTGALGGEGARKVAEQLANVPTPGTLREAVEYALAAVTDYPSGDPPVPALRDLLGRVAAVSDLTPLRRSLEDTVIKLDTAIGANRGPLALLQYLSDVLRAGLAIRTAPIPVWWLFVDGVALNDYPAALVGDAQRAAAQFKREGREVQLVRGFHDAPPELPPPAVVSIPTGTVQDEVNAGDAPAVVEEALPVPPSVVGSGVAGVLWDGATPLYIYFDTVVAAGLEAAGGLHMPGSEYAAGDNPAVWIDGQPSEVFPVRSGTLPGGRAPVYATAFNPVLWDFIEGLNPVLAEPLPNAEEDVAATPIPPRDEDELTSVGIEHADEDADADEELEAPPLPAAQPQTPARAPLLAALIAGADAIIEAAVGAWGASDTPARTVTEGADAVVVQQETAAGELRVTAQAVDDTAATVSLRLALPGERPEAHNGLAVVMAERASWTHAARDFIRRVAEQLRRGQAAQDAGDEAAAAVQTDPVSGLPMLRASAIRRMLADAAESGAGVRFGGAPFTAPRD